MKKADYTYKIEKDVVYITDLNLGSVSVTNSAEDVLSEINCEEDIVGMKILYTDSELQTSEIIPTWDDDGKCVDVDFFQNSIIVCAISDLHGYLPQIKKCNVLFIAGDILPIEIEHNRPQSKIWLETVFADWVNGLPVEKVYLVAGNHDFYFENITTSKLLSFLKATQGKLCYLKNDNAVYVSDSGKRYSIYGTPFCHIYGNYAFMREEDRLEEIFKQIPDEVDFLITHDAPYGYGYQDVCFQHRRHRGRYEHIGCPALARRLDNVKFKYAFHGHLHSSDHEAYDHNGGKMFNVSLLSEDMEPQYSPKYIEIYE